MADERWKDRVEDLTATAVEAGISMMPVIGSPMAVIANRAFALKVQQRTQRILSQFEGDIEQLNNLGRAQSAFLDSEEFLAGVHTFIRAANETSSEEKRQLLRNALLNEHVVREPRKYPPQFASLIGQYQPEHVHLLSDLAALVATVGPRIENPEWRLGRIAKDRGHPEDPFIKNYVEDLENDGLIDITHDSLASDPSRVVPRHHGAITLRGKLFLQYVDSPFAD
jgi:hypothetical protein